MSGHRSDCKWSEPFVLWAVSYFGPEGEEVAIGNTAEEARDELVERVKALRASAPPAVTHTGQ